MLAEFVVLEKETIYMLAVLCVVCWPIIRSPVRRTHPMGAFELKGTIALSGLRISDEGFVAQFF